MKRFRFFLLLLLWLPSAYAEPARELLDLPYVQGGSLHQRLDLYLPEGETSPARPLMVWIHGGGWVGGSKNDCPAKPLLQRGFVVASVEYRFSQEAVYPAQIEDCKAAVRWLRAHAAEYGIDPRRIGAWGASAGGHLVALLGTTGQDHEFDKGENLDQSSAVQCVIDWFGPTDFLHYGVPPTIPLDNPDNLVARLLGGPVSQRLELAAKASPVTMVTKDAAPFLIMQGDQDNLVPVQQSEELNEALRKAGVESTLKIIPGARHGGPAFLSPENVALMADFVGKHLQPPAHAQP